MYDGATVISLFNHKGGVSKTTTTFNLGWMLARQGKKVLMIDADPQCNLTGTVVGLDESERFYDDGLGKTNNFYKLLELNLIKGRGSVMPEIELYRITKNENLLLMAGSVDLSDIESQLNLAIEVSEGLPQMANYPGFIGHAINEIARKASIDIVLLDLSPSIGALNQCLLMSSHYFIVPTSPDFYCYQAIKSLSQKIPAWNKRLARFRSDKNDHPMRKEPPKFLGIISQRYRPYTSNKTTDNERKDTTKAFQLWIDRINEKVNNELIPALESEQMCISAAEFTKYFKEASPYNIVNIPEFNGLIARAHDVTMPVFELSQEELLSWGKAQDNQLESVSKFKEIFSEFAKNIINLIDTEKK